MSFTSFLPPSLKTQDYGRQIEARLLMMEGIGDDEPNICVLVMGLSVWNACSPIDCQSDVHNPHFSGIL